MVNYSQNIMETINSRSKKTNIQIPETQRRLHGSKPKPNF